MGMSLGHCPCIRRGRLVPRGESPGWGGRGESWAEAGRTSTTSTRYSFSSKLKDFSYDFAGRPQPRRENTQYIYGKLGESMKYFILSILLLSPFVFAGERGFYVVAVDLSGGFWDTKYYKNYLNSSNEDFPCWDKRAGNGIDVFSRKKIPQEITNDIVRSAISGNNGSINRLKNILRSYTDGKVISGYDGLYAIEHTHEMIRVYGFGARSGRIKVVNKTMKPLASGIPAGLLNNIFCEAAIPFDDKFSP